jgi:hypothetical protein
MGTDKAVQNQKVFIELHGVLSLQDLYRSVSARIKMSDDGGETVENRMYRQGEKAGLWQAISLLGLPIKD